MHNAPEQIEINIIEYGLNVLGLEFGQFWYKYFPTNNEFTGHLHIDCNVPGLSEKIRATLKMIEAIHVNDVLKCTEIPLPDYEDFKYQYFIHVRTSEPFPGYVRKNNETYVDGGRGLISW